MLIEGLALLGAFIVYRAGWARGRYVHKSEEIEYYEICGCNHSNNIHFNNGKGGCNKKWLKDGQHWSCGCMKFRPRNPLEIEEKT